MKTLLHKPMRFMGILLLLNLLMNLFFFVPHSLGGPSSIMIDFSGKPDTTGVPAGWELKVKEGNAEFKVITEDGEKVLYFRSVDTSFSFERPVVVNIDEYPYITWEWKAITLPPSGDFRKRETNDQALQILIAFNGRRILSYIWDTNAPEGSVMDESIGWPISLKIKVLAVKSGTAELGKWVTVTRNIYNDYKRLFEEEPPPVKGVRLQINTQYTGTTAESYFGKIFFKKSPEQ